MSESQTEDDRREYFRIKNWVILNFEPVESIEAADNSARLLQFDSPRIALLQELAALESDSKAYVGTLSSKPSELGNYLISLNKKIDLLTRFIIQSLSDNKDEMREVDISGGGLRFKTRQPQAIDQLIRLELVLIPECVGIVAFARVVDCQPIVDSNDYNVALVFIKLREADRDAIVRHIFQLQSKQLRGKNENSDANDE